MARGVPVDEDGLTELGRRWRSVAIAHEQLIHRYMWDVVRYRLLLGTELEFGTLPSGKGQVYPIASGGEKEKNAAPD
jgi:hypothetical protein